MNWVKIVEKHTCVKPFSIGKNDVGSQWKCDRCEAVFEITKLNHDYRETWASWKLVKEGKSLTSYPQQSQMEALGG